MFRTNSTVLVWSGWFLFLLSLLLPAAHVFSTIYGWEILLGTIEAIGKVHLHSDNVHLALAGLSKIIMIASPLGLLMTNNEEVRRFSYIIALAFIVALSFVVYYEIAQIGYYVWMTSFIFACLGFWLQSETGASNKRLQIDAAAPRA